MEGSNCQRGLVFIIGFLSLGMILSIDKCVRYRLYPLIINQIPSTLEMTLFLVKDRPFCLVASFSARQEDHFQKPFVQNGRSLQIL